VGCRDGSSQPKGPWPSGREWLPGEDSNLRVLRDGSHAPDPTQTPHLTSGAWSITEATAFCEALRAKFRFRLTAVRLCVVVKVDPDAQSAQIELKSGTEPQPLWVLLIGSRAGRIRGVLISCGYGPPLFVCLLQPANGLLR